MKCFDEDYNRLKEVMRFFADTYLLPLLPAGFPAHGHPVAVLEGFEKQSGSVAVKSLKMGIADFVEMANEWPADQLAAADAALKVRGLPTLSELSIDYSKAYRRIFRRGSIRTEQEYYMLKNARDEGRVASGEADFVKLEQMIASYEKSVTEQPGTDRHCS